MIKHIIILVVIFATAAPAHSKRHFEIGLLLDSKTPEVAPLLGALEEEIRAVLGEDATIAFSAQNILSNDYNLEVAQENYDALLNSNTDIILAYGVVNSMIISKQLNHLKPTILFGVINKDFMPIIDDNQSSGIRNFTYITASHSFKEDLATLRELSGFHRVGIAVESAMLDILPFKETMDAYAEEQEFIYEIIPFDTVEDILLSIGSDIDAFYLAGGFMLNNAEIEKLAIKLVENKIPSFTSTFINDVETGLMATNQAEENLDRIFRRIALNIEAFIGGQDLSELPTYINNENRLTVNFNTAENVGMPIRYSLVGRTSFVGEFINVLSEKTYTLLDVIQEVMISPHC